MTNPKLRAQRLTVAYDEQPVLHELDLLIPAQLITAVVGSNASGKSTLLRTLARLLAPRGGTVLLDGADIHRLPTREVARRVGLLPQSAIAPDGLTVEELVSRGRYPHQRWFQRWTEADETAVAGALEATRTTELADRPLDTLSGGQRQRAWVAMALAQETETLLLDEPTTHLDMAHQLDVLELVLELNRSDGRTVVMVLHDLNQAARYAHHLVAVRAGRVVVAGPPGEVVTEELVADVFGIECQVIESPVTGTPLCLPVRPVALSDARGEDSAADDRAGVSGGSETTVSMER